MAVFKVSSTSIRRSRAGCSSPFTTKAEEHPSESCRCIACCATSFRIRVKPPRLANCDISAMDVFSFWTAWRSDCGSLWSSTITAVDKMRSLLRDRERSEAMASQTTRKVRIHKNERKREPNLLFFQLKGWQVSQKDFRTNSLGSIVKDSLQTTQRTTSLRVDLLMPIQHLYTV